MKKRDYRLVEFISNYSSNEKRKGLFHFWNKRVEGDNHEIHTAFIEDLMTGKIVKNNAEDIRFLTEKETINFWAEADNAQIW